MKLYFIKFALWLYTTHIQEDWSVYTKIGKIMLYPVWFVRAMLIWITFPLWIPAYQFTQSKVYRHYQEFGKAMSKEEQLEQIKQMKIQRNMQRNNFILQKEKRKF